MAGATLQLSPQTQQALVQRRFFPILETSHAEKTRLADKNKQIDGLYAQGKQAEANSLRENSAARLTVMMGPWKCNFDCPICYTNGMKDGILTAEQTIQVIEQGRGMGVKLTYWPGEGEFTLLRVFWIVMYYLAEIGLPAVFFTNCSIFHDDRIAQGVLGTNSSALLDKLQSAYPLMHFYGKLWHSDPDRAAELVGVKPSAYPYETVRGMKIPLGLANLLSGIGTERIGAEVMVSQENYEDVVQNIIPTILELGIYAYIEPIIFSGAAQGKFHLQLTPEQYASLAPVFASGGDFCDKRQSTELILKGDKFVPGIAIPPRPEDRIVDDAGHPKDIFGIFHNEHFRKMRVLSENSRCICRDFWEGRLPLEQLPMLHGKET